VTALVSTPGARVLVYTPEVEAAKASGWDEGFRVTPRQSLAPAAEWEGSLGAGAQQVVSLVLRIPQPGYYRLVATARTIGRQTADVWRERIEDSATQEIWLLIDDAGGAVTSTFEGNRLQGGSIQQPGPKRAMTGKQLSPAAHVAGGQRGQARLQSIPLTQGMEVWQAVWFNAARGEYDYLSEATVYVDYWDSYTSLHMTTSVLSTDTDGMFQIWCSYDWSYTGAIRMENASLSMSPLEAGWFGGSANWCDDQVLHQAFVSGQVAHVWAEMRRIRVASTALLGVSPGPIRVLLTFNTGQVSHYSPGGVDKVFLFLTDYTSEWATFVMAHEYGHHVNNRALGGYPDPNCPDHYWGLPSSLTCAYVEGFADYHAAATRSDELPYWRADLDAHAPYNNEGSVDEIAVANLLFDLTDPVGGSGSELGDTMQYPGSFVADLINSCVVYQSSVWRRPNGIDHLILCLENQVDYNFMTGYFPERSPSYATAQSNGASAPSGFSVSAVRALWLWNLYRQ
jgi:hypothetical protein